MKYLLTEIKNVANFINGFPFKPTDWCETGMKIIRIQNLTNPSKPYNLTIRDVPKKYIVKKGDILVSWSATIDVFEWEEEDAYLNQHIFKVEFDEKKVAKTYFKLALKKTINDLIRFAHGSTMKHVVKGDFDNHQIPLPPLKDQIHIANLLTRAENLIAKRKESIKALDDLLKSTFLEMFGDPVKNEKGYSVEKLLNIVQKITDGTHKTPQYVSEGITFISAKNIKKGKIDWRDVKYITAKEHDELFKRCNPVKGDLLLTKSGSLGMAAIIDVNFKFSLFESLALIKIKTDCINLNYLCEFLNLESVRKLYTQITKGVGVKHLHLIDIKSLPILLPPMPEQIRFSKIIEKLEKLRTLHYECLVKLENLYISLSQQAFMGKLDLKRFKTEEI